MTPKVFYPEIEVQHNTTGTILRKKYRGKWYKWVFIVSSTTVQQSIDEIHRNVYKAILFGKIDPTMEDLFGKKLFEKDQSQISEEKRLNLSLV